MTVTKVSKSLTSKPAEPHRKALTPEAREMELISLSMDCAEEQLRNGTASSQVITHFLKLGTEQARLERIKLERENMLLEAKTDAIKSAQRLEELYSDAIVSMKEYSGQSEEDDNDTNVF